MVRQLRYMASYAGDYSKYMNGQGSQGGSQGGDYKQHLFTRVEAYYNLCINCCHQEFVGPEQQRYMDYSKYTQNHGSQGGDYKQRLSAFYGSAGKPRHASSVLVQVQGTQQWFGN